VAGVVRVWGRVWLFPGRFGFSRPAFSAVRADRGRGGRSGRPGSGSGSGVRCWGGWVEFPVRIRAGRGRAGVGGGRRAVWASAEILMELWASTPQPHHMAAPSIPSKRLRRQPKSRFRQEIRASEPVRHFTSLVNRRPALHLGAGRAGSASPGDGHGLDAQRFEFGVDFGLAVTAVGGDRWGARPNRVLIRAIAGTSMGASGGFPFTTTWSMTTPSALSATWALNPNSTGRRDVLCGWGGRRDRGGTLPGWPHRVSRRPGGPGSGRRSVPPRPRSLRAGR
jgi:hypothetical protein